MSDDALTLDRIRAAAMRLDAVAHRTPLLSSTTLNERCGARVLLKAEPYQRTGSFKFRGAYNRLSVLHPAARAAGVVAFSSGNHGAAVALAARLLGIPAVIVVPADGSAAKLNAIEGYGAELRRYDPLTESREEVAAQIATDRAMTLVRPFDDHDVMAGQGTIGLELADQAPDLDLVLVPVGGGGLAAGVSTAVTSLLPRASIIGVEPAIANDTSLSFRAGRRLTIDEPPTIADGLRAREPGELTFAVNSRLLSDVATVSEDDIIESMRFCFTRLKVVVEPSGAVALAALLAGAVRPSGCTIVVLSGGNIDPSDFSALMTAEQPVS
ncbi:MAG TPA: threonine/serine dehydratase [Streptosporangiaceae bacterium]|nr:threonine/serine dehydratase [Streptosporangiaceae bacterium]